MKLYAISDLHLGYEANQRALSGITSHPADWLILAGDVGETAAHLELAFRELKPRFAKLVWGPGNHELWTLPSSDEKARGRFKYDELIELCRFYEVLTPEDPYPIVTIGGREVRIAPLFILYDYSFRPLHIPIERAVDWEREERDRMRRRGAPASRSICRPRRVVPRPLRNHGAATENIS
jgi:3',5'-cyclic AMP phosphodiesterase CpdA